jgi:U3 small nucleolar RNA-associated protein 15
LWLRIVQLSTLQMTEVFNKIGAVPFNVGETRTKDEQEESAVWQSLTETKILQFSASIPALKFSPIAPHSLVVLTGISGPWINGKTHVQDFAFAKAKAPFSSLAFRKDGILIALGREDGTVDIYPTKDHQTLLRRFKLRSGVVFSLCFSPFSNTLIVGCGDGTIQIIDISALKDVVVIKAHNDAVTAIVPLESGNIWVSGSNDGTVSVWDLNTQEKISSIEAPTPVSKLVAKGRRIFAACSENVLVLDILTNIVKVNVVPLHTRQIVDMRIVRSNLVTASADRTLKVVDPASFSVLYSIKMHLNIVAFDALPDASKLAVALIGGAVQLRYLPRAQMVRKERPVAQMPANFRVFKPQKPGKREIWNQRLAKFEYGEALDLALEESPAVAVGMIDELDRVGGLEAAIAGRDASAIQPLLKFLISNVSNPMWSSVILKAVIVFEKIYRQVIGDVPAIGKMFDELSVQIKEELELQRQATRLVGQIDLLLK